MSTERRGSAAKLPVVWVGELLGQTKLPARYEAAAARREQIKPVKKKERRY